MKKIFITTLVLIMSILFVSCGGEEPTENNTNIDDKNVGNYSIIDSSKSIKIPEGMKEYDSCELGSNNNGSVKMYTDAPLNDEGIIENRENNRFMILAKVNYKSFVIMDEKPITKGQPSINVFEDKDKKLHLLLTISSDNQYIVNDYVYDSEGQCFNRYKICEYEGINNINNLNK